MKMIEAFGEVKSESAWARDERAVEAGVTRSCLKKRVADGWTFEDALTTPLLSSNGTLGKRLTHKGFGEAKSISEWARDDRWAGRSRKLLSDRLAGGMSVEEAFSLGAVPKPGRPAGFLSPKKGLSASPSLNDPDLLARLGSTTEIVATVGCSPSAALRALHKFGLFEETRPVRYEAFGESKSLREWTEDDRTKAKSIGTIHSRIHTTGMPVEDALVAEVSESASFAEKQVADFLTANEVPLVRNDRSVIAPLEIDILVPELNVGIEFNGLFWHSSEKKPKDFHHIKYLRCKEAGVHLIQVWEDDWRDRRHLVEDMLLHKLGRSLGSRTYARNTSVVSVGPAVKRKFLEKYHIQGTAGSSVSLGLLAGDELVAIACFKKCRKEAADWDMVRYATAGVVVGGFTKLLRTFCLDHSGTIKTFADLTVSDGSLYSETGWTEDGFVPPDYRYVYRGSRYHKFGFRKERFRTDPLLKYRDGLTETELAELNGLKRIYDAGKIRYTITTEKVLTR